MFRDNENITTDASGYLLLPSYVHEVEFMVPTSNTNMKLELMDIEDKYNGTGFYEHGMDTSVGKRRLMVREGGAAKVSTAYTVHYLKEYSDLTSTAGTPYPFVASAHLDLLTTLQAYFYYAEQGREKEKDAVTQLNLYKAFFGDGPAKEKLNDEAVYGRSSHSDTGNKRAFPIFNPSNS